MVLEVVVAAFVVTQLCYFGVNCGLLGLFVRRPSNTVDERTLGRVLEGPAGSHEGRLPQARTEEGRVRAGPTVATAPATASQSSSDPNARTSAPADGEHGPGPRCRLSASHCRPIHVFVPLEPETTGARGLEKTLGTIARQSYPISSITVYVVFDSQETTESELDDSIETYRAAGLEVVPVEIDRDALVTERADYEWLFTGIGVPAQTAAALTHAYETRSIPADDLVTVFDPGTRIPVDTFELAVAGLESYDIIQAKLTVGNADDGVLPLLESTASAAWSDLCYASSRGPYHLLGAGYLMEASVLADLDRWQHGTADDVTLGVAASRRGYTLGIVDRYVGEHCPTTVGTWIREKRQWVRTPYHHLRRRGWAGVDELRHWTGTLLVQVLALITVVGLPAGLLVAWLVDSGTVSLSVPILLLVGFNGLVWTYYGVRAYRAAWDALPYKSRWHQLGYSIVVNPLTYPLYALCWAVPICLGVIGALRGPAAVDTDTASVDSSTR